MSFHIKSGCGYENFEHVKERLELTNSMTAVPYFSAIKFMLNETDTAEIDKAKRAFLEGRNQVSDRRTVSEKACLVGLSALDLAGVIESKRLM